MSKKIGSLNNFSFHAFSYYFSSIFSIKVYIQQNQLPKMRRVFPPKIWYVEQAKKISIFFEIVNQTYPFHFLQDLNRLNSARNTNFQCT